VIYGDRRQVHHPEQQREGGCVVQQLIGRPWWCPGSGVMAVSIGSEKRCALLLSWWKVERCNFDLVTHYKQKLEDERGKERYL